MTTQQPKLSPLRRGRITGSNVGAILGLSPFRTPDDVLRAMVRDYHGAPSEFTGNAATEYGSFHEAGALVEYQMHTSNTVQDCKEAVEHGFFIHPVCDWLGATPDFLVGKDGLGEIKCPYGLRDKEAPVFKTAREQPHYYAQMQIEMACAGKKWVVFFQWCPKLSVLELVYRDDKWLAENIPRLAEFHALYVSELNNPDHLKPRRKIVESPTARKMIDEISDLSQIIDNATTRKKEVLAELVDLVGGVDAEVCGHKLTQVEKEGAVSYAKVVKDYIPDVDLEPYRGKPSSFWKLS
jgi:putative phage-type endonuclease